MLILLIQILFLFTLYFIILFSVAFLAKLTVRISIYWSIKALIFFGLLYGFFHFLFTTFVAYENSLYPDSIYIDNQSLNIIISSGTDFFSFPRFMLFILPIVMYEWYLRTYLGDIDVQSIEAKEIRNKAALKLFLSYGATVIFLFLWLLISATGENAGYKFLGIFFIAPAGAILISIWFVIRERIMSHK